MENRDDQKSVPLFGSWRAAYIFVIAFLAFEVILFYIISTIF